MKNILVIGGGTGSYTVLSGLKKKEADLTAVVTVADSGGSTGRLRDEFGHLPVGDFRMALVALSDVNGDNDLMRDLFLYRFDKGDGLKGHNFGNLLLTALSDILKDEDKAFEYASKILRVKGSVLPVTKENITLIAEYDNGTIVFGESSIDEPNDRHDGTARITNLRIQPKASVTKKALEAIYEADLVVMGPGDLYTSVLANAIVEGVSDALKETKAKFAFVVNLINKYGQTYKYKASDYLRELENYTGRHPDYVLVNTTPLPQEILTNYEKEKGYPVDDDLEEKPHFKIIRHDLLAEREYKRVSGDVLKRSLIRHDSDKLADILYSLI